MAYSLIFNVYYVVVYNLAHLIRTDLKYAEY